MLLPGGLLCAHSPCRLSEPSWAGGTCVSQALAQQLPPDKGKIIAASSYHQLAAGRSHPENGAVSSASSISSFCSQEGQTWLVLFLSVTELKIITKRKEWKSPKTS